MEFEAIELCLAMKCDYWTLMLQPKRHLELFKLYLQIQGKVQAEQQRKELASLQRARAKGRGYGR